jgi:hypothetical protein
VTDNPKTIFDLNGDWRAVELKEELEKLPTTPAVEKYKELLKGLPDDKTIRVNNEVVPEEIRNGSVRPEHWRPKGWTHKKERAYQSWVAHGKPGSMAGGENPGMADRKVFSEMTDQVEQEREIAELVRRLGGVA